MPARTRWLPEVQTMLVSHHGVVDGDDLYATDSKALEQCLDKGDDVRYLADFRGGDIVLTTEDVVEHAQRMNALDFWNRIPGLRVAMISVDPKETAFGLVFNRRAVEAGMQIFSTVEAACAFLGIDPSSLRDHEDLIPPSGSGRG